MRVEDLQSIRIKLASPEEVISWSHGEITKPETINYRTQRPEKDGLFCEKIFGPERDYECYCGKYKRVRYKGIVCDRCGVEVTKSSVRRDRMGHIKLACPVSHIWFLRGVPSRIGQVLDLPMLQLEKVIYFASYVIITVDEEEKKSIAAQIEAEFNEKTKTQKKILGLENSQNTAKDDKAAQKELQGALEELRDARDRAKSELNSIQFMRVISEAEYRNLSLKYGQCFSAGTGAETIRKLCEKVDIDKTIEVLKKKLEESSPEEKRKIYIRLKLLQGIQQAGIRPEWMLITALPVLPADLRPIVQLDGGRYASSDLNDLYRRVINRNNRLKYLQEIGAPEVIVRNEKRMLQEAVDSLIDNGMRKGTTTQATTGGRRLLKSLADMLKGKQGRFRQNLLGKRVDYSGRSVIVVGPHLRLNQVGIPKKMALELFKPFVIRRILEKEMAFNVRGASRLIEAETDEIWAILEEVVKNKLVLINRAPTLHRLSIQAFNPVLIEGEALQIHPMVCKAFNADFDGDQMAVHLPLSEMAQKEARERMLSSLNLLKPAKGTPVVTVYQDMVLGCYWLTTQVPGAKGEGKVFATPGEAILYYEFGEVDLRAKIKVRDIKPSAPGFIETTAGRIIFNQTLPDDFRYVNQMVKVKDLESIAEDIIRKYDTATTEDTLDLIKELGFEYSTVSGISWGMDDLHVPVEKAGIVKDAEKEVEKTEDYYAKGLLSRDEKKNKIIDIWSKAKSTIEALVPKTLSNTSSVYQMIDAGARGSWSQPVQMAGMKGLVVDPSGDIIELPVKNSYKEGLDVLEYFNSTHGARKGTVDTALRTSTAGYLTRRLVDVAHEAIISENDCGDTEGFDVLFRDSEEIGQNFLYKVVGHVSMENIKSSKTKEMIVKEGELIDWETGRKLIDENIEKIKVRSPLSCKSIHGLCQKCYGWDLGNNKMVRMGEAVGIIAAQSIGEPGTQLTMRTFHTGGVASGADITSGLPRVEEIFEARIPGGKAEICPADGTVLEIISEKGQNKIIKIKIKSKDAAKDAKETKASREAKAAEAQKAAKEGQLPKGYQIIDFSAPSNVNVLVKAGDEIKKGQPLWEGSLDLKELYKFVGKDVAQRYILKEVQRIYSSQGATIHDKHIAVIIRQMFSRVKIKDPGDSLFTPKEVIEIKQVLEANEILAKQGKKLVEFVPVLLGVSKVALTTGSWLSSASFQETSRVLIKASLERLEDKLDGLKENVIIGKLIPAGTGFHYQINKDAAQAAAREEAGKE
ncbi:MAG: DNA-directed RNA polymerase subunit beta' [Candidatus Nealsonbacteria bacterium DGGOD1a]|jgi:DNA-directed RNA polymerase, beta'' subunit, predominant form|nr:MAG: DNA-directed RNA polymerase subunit beta' [Candidatus Nealsonbacteria bacterium DGGOD1a]